MTENKSFHQCIKCSKIFNYKSEYDRHLKRKISCMSKDKNLEENRKCTYCDNVYARIDSLERHLTICKAKILHEKAIDDELEKNPLITKILNDMKKEMQETNERQQKEIKEIKEKQLKELQEMKEKQQRKEKEVQELKEKQQKKEREMQEIQKELYETQKELQKKKEQEIRKEIQREMEIEMQKEIAKMREEFVKSQTENQKNININGNLNNNIQNNIHNEIKIIAYGKEDTSYITDNEYELLINKGFKSVPNLVEYIHFNGNKPENQNIYISNMRDNYVLVYDGEQWQMRERDDVLQDMIDNKTDILNEKFDELLDRLDEITIKRFKKFLDEKDDDKVSAQLKKDLKLILYNRKKVATVKPRYFSVVKSKVDNDQKDEENKTKSNETEQNSQNLEINNEQNYCASLDDDLKIE